MRSLSGYFFWYDGAQEHVEKSITSLLIGGRAKLAFFLQDAMLSRSTGRCSKKQLTEIWPRKLNLARVTGLLAGEARGEVSVVYAPSPLSMVWDEWRLKNDAPESANPRDRRIYRSVASSDRYVRLRGLVEYPDHLGFSVVVDDLALSLEKLAQNLAERVVEELGKRQLRWLGVVDVFPRDLGPDIAQLLLGHEPPLADRLDKFMLTPSLVVMGDRIVIEAYAADLAAEYAEERIALQTSGCSAYVQFLRVDSVDRAFLPKWHQRSRV